MSGLNPLTGRDERGLGARSAFAMPPAPAPSPRSGGLPVVVIAVACVVVALITLIINPSVDTVREVLAGVTCGIALILAIAVLASRASSRRVADQVQTARLVTQRGQVELQQMVDRLMRGEQPAPLVPAPARAADGDPFTELTMDLEQAQYHAGQAVLRVADKVFGGRSDHRVEIFVNVARRMQSLVHREIELLDDLESKVEDPELLKGLFIVDHLATRLRRQSESLAVLGGSASRRQWARQVTMHEVLRAAVAEVEQYSRVKVVPPVEGVLRGAAVTDVIHLIAELVENATKFSAPHTTALLRAQHVSAGVAIEIEDRGLGMLASDQQRMNDLLADPSGIDVDELLRDGRIGLYVVATLARRHGIRVRMQNNIYGGTQAVVVLPKQLLEPAERDHPPYLDAGKNPSGNTAKGKVPSGDTARERAPRPSLELVPASGGGSAGADGGTDAPAGSEPAPAPLPKRKSSAGKGGGRTRQRATGSQRAVGTSAETDAPPRPPLPKRQPQASYVRRPLDDAQPPGTANSRSSGTKTSSTEPPAEQMAGLMANFLQGVSRAENEEEDNDSPAGD